MQHDSQYPSSSEDARSIQRSSTTIGALAAWVLIGLLGILVASGLIALIVMLWRVIL